MPFAGEFEKVEIVSLLERARNAPTAAVRETLGRGRLTLADFACLISPAGREFLDALCARSQAVTQKRFGKVIRLFAPLYVSNECINNCKYCGFSRDNVILRVTLTLDQVRREARALTAQGFRNILLVAGEHPKFISAGYLAECVRVLREEAPSVSLEVGPMETEQYRPLVEAGAD